MYKLIFDFDGTLADTHPLIVESFLSTAQHYGLKNPNRQWLEDNMGMGLKEMMQQFIPNLVNYDEAIEFFRNYQMSKFVETVKLFDGVAVGLKILKEKGYQMSIFTNKSTRFLAPILTKYNLQLGYFDYIIGSEDVNNPKPNPEGILKIANLYQTTSQNCVMIGDSYADILCGQNAGVKTIAITHNNLPFSIKTIESRADFYADNFKELVRFLQMEL